MYKATGHDYGFVSCRTEKSELQVKFGSQSEVNT